MADRPPINGEHLVTEQFGYWPSFHDAEIHWLRLNRTGPTAEFLVHAFDMTDTVDERGYYVLTKHCLVHFRCDGLIGSTLDGFNHQNVLFGLGIDYISDKDNTDHWELSLETSYGLDGVITCESVSVTSITPCNSKGETGGA